jgi:hypothetical protein
MGPGVRIALPVVIAALAACGEPPPQDSTDLSAGDAAADLAEGQTSPGDLGVADLAEPPTPADLAPPPYAGNVTLPVKTQLEWTGGPSAGVVEEAHFVDGRGTLRVSGVDLPAVVYKKIPFGVYTLGAIVATRANGFVLSYAYCRDGLVRAFYYETPSSGVVAESPLASQGPCTFVDQPSPGPVSFTRPSSIAYGTAPDPAKIDGARIQLDNGHGTITYGGVDWDLTVFATVDCTAALCGGLGWNEVHVALQRGDALALAILYLSPDRPTQVMVGYGFRFDQPAMWPADELLAATWTLK